MKLKFTLRILGCTLLAVLTPTVLTAQTLSYGTTRKPHTCPSTVEPKKGAPSVEQAKMYFLCDQEWERPRIGSIGSALWLISDLTLQVAPHSRPANGTDLTFNTRHGGEHLGMDTDQPVYDIRASFTSYICNEIRGSYREGKNCTVSQFPSSTGICFRNTFGDWHCRAKGSSKKIGDRLPPPQN
ncbi:MAG: hypothetical protein RMX68_025495 [Aulosira sp. ZfuVER01]|nr:hypothetical protein [Aulosira sp. ZfuVER01]MDZ8001777.1 hypothetical protein [Aulosira sp. DedVER01a]MDZ8053252.1 hypothetical protein [Aulosira sp. ZfuCHP01]